MNTPHSKILDLPLKISSQTQPALAHRVPRQRAECLAPFLVPSEEPNHRVKHRSKGPFPLAPLHTVTASLGPRMVTFQFDFYPAKQFWLNRFSKPTVVVVRKRQPSPRPSGAQVVTVIWLADSDAVHAHSPCHCQSHTNTVYNKHNSFWQHWTIFIISSVLMDIFLDDWWLKKKKSQSSARTACLPGPIQWMKGLLSSIEAGETFQRRRVRTTSRWFGEAAIWIRVSSPFRMNEWW